MKIISRIILISCALISLFSDGILAQTKVPGSSLKRGKAKIIDTLNNNSILRIDPFRLEIVSPSSGVQFYKNGLVFLSNSKTEGKMPLNHTSFGNVEAYYAVLIDSSLGEHILFSPLSQFEVPCEGMTFNADYTIMYFTKRSSRNEPEKIFRAKYADNKNNTGEWISDPKPVNFCSDKATYSHPALSYTGDTMVFASDRKGSLGGFDLFITHKEGNDWSSPENSGSNINTSGNELFPFLDSGNNLFYSSDGLSGEGGYDIFVCMYNGKGWDRPLNLSKNLNSVNDELAFTLDRKDGKSAFFTSRSRTGKQLLKLNRVTFLTKTASNNYISLSNAFNYLAGAGSGEPETAGAVSTNKVVAMATETTPPVSKPKPPREVNMAADTLKANKTLSVPAQTKPASQPAVTRKPEEKKPEGIKAIQEKPVTQDIVVYRVQYFSGRESKGKFDMTVGGKSYKTFEYFYNGMYRSCVGEFSTPGQAASLQRIIKQEGFPDAFVAAFKNNIRSLDPSLFKR